MTMALKENYRNALDKQKREVRNFVIKGLKQIKEGSIKDFNTTCDSLGKKYRDKAVLNCEVDGERFGLQNK